MNASLSCHEAFRGNRAFEAVLAKKPTAATKMREYAEVALKIWVSCWLLIVAGRRWTGYKVSDKYYSLGITELVRLPVSCVSIFGTPRFTSGGKEIYVAK